MRLIRARAKPLTLALFGLALLIGLPYACLPIYRFQPPAPFTGAQFFNPYAQLTGTWQRANLHTHGRAWSGLTSGRHSNEEVVERYRELGYSVPGISNYHEIAAHDGVPTLPLYEHGYNLGKHHQLAVGAHRVEWFDLPLWQSRSQKQFIINRVAATADLVAIVHPVSRNAYSPEDLRSLTGYQLLEIVNGKFPHDEAWDAALSAGHVVWGVADDDNHDLEDTDRLAVAWTMIDAPTPSTADIVQALRTGRSYAVLRTGEGSTDADIALVGLTFKAGTLIVSTSGAPATISFVGQNGQIKKTVEETSAADYMVGPSDTYIRAIARTSRATIYLNPLIRYDGVALPATTAQVDTARTWLLRGVVTITAAVAAIAIFRRRRGTPRGVRGIAIAAMVCAASPVSAQDVPLWSVYDWDELADLPTADSPFAVLETMQPSLISDRFSNGGLFTGQPARIGGFLSSWSQTIYRVNDVDITDPTGGGTPLLIPDPALALYMIAQTALPSSQTNAAGLAVSIAPRWPVERWTGTAQAAASHFGSMARKGRPPPIAGLRSWDRVAASVSGPLVPQRAGIVSGGSWTRESQAERGSNDGVQQSLGSAFAHIVLTPYPSDVIEALGWVQRAAYPFTYRVPFGDPDASTSATAAHLQAVWHRRRPWLIYGGYTRRHTSHDYESAAAAAFEQLRDGSPSDLAWTAPGTTGRWSIGSRLGPATVVLGKRHVLRGGLELGGAAASATDFFGGVVTETVSGRPARLWRFAAASAESHRTTRTFAVDLDDRISVASRVTADGGIRFDAVAGSARGAVEDVRWRSWLPRGQVNWIAANRWQTTIFAGYRRSAYRLPLDFLAAGDPAAPTAAVYWWAGPSPAANTVAPLVMRVGPGTGSSRAFSGIDPELARPIADEVAIGIDLQPRGGVRFAWTGIVRRERHLAGLVNTGAPASAYSPTAIADPGADVLNPEDDRIVTAYNRRPDTFGLDRYLLTNPATEDASFKGFEITLRYTTPRFLVFGGATAGQAEGFAASRGFGPLENDQSRLGELYINPNAATFARGRLFNDRAYTAKLAGVIKFSDEWRLGVIARYQDGQPFSRVLIVPNLNQGVEAVRAFPAGDSRFTYTATLDVRVQKLVLVHGRRIAAFADAYNLTNLANEVEEVTTSAPGVRIASAVQPPLAIHLGVRVGF